MAQSFRDWLIARVKLTDYATDDYTDEQIEKLALKIGVQPDVLFAARTEMRIELKERGFVRNRRHMQIELLMPDAIWEAWKDECEFRSVDGPALLRSLIHDYLLGTHEPKEPLMRWRFRGKLYYADRDRRKITRERALIPIGAHRGLMARGRVTGTTGMAIVRSLVVEVLEGGHRNLLLVDAKSMYDDAERYRDEAALRSEKGLRPVSRAR